MERWWDEGGMEGLTLAGAGMGAPPIEEAIWIISNGSYRIDRIGWIVSVSVLCLLGETGFYALDNLMLDVRDRWNGWDVGGTGVR